MNKLNPIEDNIIEKDQSKQTPAKFELNNHQINRLKSGKILNNKKISFKFNEEKLQGYEGDTLASALLANNKILVGRSFKYHRPRGIFSAGTEEPNALLEIGKNEYQEPNVKATTIKLFEGLESRSQNHLGSLNFDLLAINDFLHPFLSAGFYYKTFMWPKSFWEKFYEPAIRRAAGLGSLSGMPDPSTYDKGFLHCDVLIVGGGPAGLSAALEAGRANLKVIIADDDFLFGGRLNSENFIIDDQISSEWSKKSVEELSNMSNVRIMPRTSIYGSFDHGIFGGLEIKYDNYKDQIGKPRQILWKIYTKFAIICTGSTERSIAFGNNDRPGIMLSGAIRSYVNRWSVCPGKNVVIFTNNDDGWRTAQDLKNKNINIKAIIDSRENINLNDKEIPIFKNTSIIDTSGRKQISSVTLSSGEVIKCDCLGVSGGWNPNVHLTCHQRGKPIWEKSINAFIPGKTPSNMLVAGTAAGLLQLGENLKSGHTKAQQVILSLGLKCSSSTPPKAENESATNSSFWHVGASKKRSWVDLQNDVTTKDIKISYEEGFRSVEHLKRYSTLGMATDQGKTSNILGLAVLAEYSGKSIPDTGTTIFRPPYNPVPIGAFAGRSRGKEFKPVRLTPSHKEAENLSATFVEAGLWLRAQWYPLKGETHWRESVDREVIQTRKSVGICDVTTLGKIDIQGQDAAEFLDCVYTNGFSKLDVGKVRYGLMLREDGMVMDDGTTARFDLNHFVMTTTTANAVSVFRHLEFCRQCLYPNLDVHLISATEQWAQFAVAGPNSRKLLEKIIDKEYDISNLNFPYMGCKKITICNNIPARLFRISFSGELAYEIAVPSRYGNSMFKVLMDAGSEFNVVAYGTEALGVMRIEKGHAAGNELNGQTTAQNLGLEKMMSKKKDFVGNVLSRRSELNKESIVKLVGFKPVNKEIELKAGAHFISLGKEACTKNDEGWMSSVAFSPSLNHSIGLGFIKNGNNRIGEIVNAVDPLRKSNIEVEIVSPHFLDPEGERLRE